MGMRLNVLSPLAGAAMFCQNYSKKGVSCATRCGGDKGQHALTCQYGGLSIDRHDNIAKALAKWLKQLGFATKLEQHAPEYDDKDHRAQLDLSYTDPIRGRT